MIFRVTYYLDIHSAISFPIEVKLSMLYMVQTTNFTFAGKM